MPKPLVLGNPRENNILVGRVDGNHVFIYYTEKAMKDLFGSDYRERATYKEFSVLATEHTNVFVHY